MSKEEYKALKESTIRLILEHVPTKMAQKTAIGLLKKVIKDMKKAETYNTGRDYKDYLYLITNLSEEGLTVSDIKWYFSMDLVREWMFCEINNIIRTERMLALKDTGLSTKEAMVKLRKSMPIFGERSKETLNLTEEDANLPQPLQRRVDLYVARYKERESMKFIENLQSFSSFNAFIRSEIRASKLKDIEDYGSLDAELEIRQFKSKIKEQEDILFGIKLYNENIDLLYDKETAYQANQHHKNIKQRGEESIIQAKELLEEVRKSSDMFEYLLMFEFPPAHGLGLDEMTERAKILVETYDELFPERPREKSLAEDEKYFLL